MAILHPIHAEDVQQEPKSNEHKKAESIDTRPVVLIAPGIPEREVEEDDEHQE